MKTQNQNKASISNTNELRNNKGSALLKKTVSLFLFFAIISMLSSCFVEVGHRHHHRHGVIMEHRE